MSRGPMYANSVDAGPAAGERSILVLDDAAVDRHRVMRVARSAGFAARVDEAGCLADLRTALDRTSYDLILVDYDLGLHTGFDALGVIRAHEDQADAIPIMISGTGAPDLVVKAMHAGCVDFLHKDHLTPDRFRDAVTTALDRRSLLGAIDRSTRAYQRLERSLRRFGRSCGAEMRSVIQGFRQELKVARAMKEVPPAILPHLTTLDSGARDVGILIDEMLLHLAELTADLDLGVALRLR